MGKVHAQYAQYELESASVWIVMGLALRNQGMVPVGGEENPTNGDHGTSGAPGAPEEPAKIDVRNPIEFFPRLGFFSEKPIS